MVAPIGNKFWMARSSHGAHPVFSHPDQLWEACIEYFEWTVNNPLIVHEPIKFQGEGTLMEVPKLRAMTLQGLCGFLGITTQTWCVWRRSRQDLSEVITRAEEIIYRQKFEGAAAELLSPNIIARDLGLSDKSELTGKNGGPIEMRNVRDLSDEQLAEIAAGDKGSE